LEGVRGQWGKRGPRRRKNFKVLSRSRAGGPPTGGRQEAREEGKKKKTLITQVRERPLKDGGETGKVEAAKPLDNMKPTPESREEDGHKKLKFESKKDEPTW